jgi:hypothetical protein
MKTNPTSLAAAKIQFECIGSIEMEKGLMYALCTHYFESKNQAENIGTSLIPILSVTTEIWAVVFVFFFTEVEGVPQAILLILATPSCGF